MTPLKLHPSARRDLEGLGLQEQELRRVLPGSPGATAQSGEKITRDAPQTVRTDSWFHFGTSCLGGLTQNDGCPFGFPLKPTKRKYQPSKRKRTHLLRW